MKKLLIGVFALALLAGCASNGGETGQVTGGINVYTRDSSSGTREAFEKGIGFEGELTADAIEVSSNDDMAAKVGADLNGIGYVSLSTDFEKNGVKAVQYEGVTASTETVLDGTYLLQRPFNFVTRASGDFESDDKEQLVLAFLDYLQNSVEGQAVVAKNGGEVDSSNAVAWEELAAKYPVLNQDNSGITIRTVGSTSVEKTVKAALEAFQPLAGNVQFEMNQTGSSDGYKNVLGESKDGSTKGDIGFASRAFNDEEDVTNALVSGTYCVDAVVAIVNAENNDYDNLTQEQLYNIFTGATTNWEDVE